MVSPTNTLDATNTQDSLSLCATYRELNDQRVDIDRRITALPPDDAGRETLWQELDSVLTRLRKVVDLLARAPATDMIQLRAKAVVLAALLRPGDAGGGPVLAESTSAALALSLADEIAEWRSDSAPADS